MFIHNVFIFKLTALFIVSIASKKCSEFVLVTIYLQLIKSGHVDNSVADKKHGKLSS